MKKITLATFAALCLCLCAGAQTVQNSIVQTNINGDNALQALELLGVKMFNFDVSKLSAEGEIFMYVEEKAGDSSKRVQEIWLASRNGMEKLSIYIIPQSDSVAKVSFIGSGSDPHSGSWSKMKLQPIYDPRLEDTKYYYYDTLPYDQTVVEETRRKIPLVLYGSGWWDEEFKNFRFCLGAQCAIGLMGLSVKTDPKELNVLPHYYILGMEIR